MKAPREVYIKLREVKHYHLIKLYKDNLKRKPENCKYNHIYQFKRDKNTISIGLCFLHQTELQLPKERTKWPIDNNDGKIYPHLLDICEEIHHSSHCNAFVFRYTKEEIKENYNKILKDKKLEEKFYPDICALEWVLNEPVLAVHSITNWIHKIYLKLKINIRGMFS